MKVSWTRFHLWPRRAVNTEAVFDKIYDDALKAGGCEPERWHRDMMVRIKDNAEFTQSVKNAMDARPPMYYGELRQRDHHLHVPST